MTQETGIIRTSHLLKSGRRPPIIEDRRVCAAETCKTVLSKYNTSDRCHQHRAVRFPRIRGVIEAI